MKYLFGFKRTYLFVFLFLLFAYNNALAKPYGLRKTNKTVQFDTTIEFNYLFIDHESFVQFALIEEISFGTIDFGFGIYAPISFNNHYRIRPITYNSMHGLIGLIYYMQYGFWDGPIAIKVSEIKHFTLGSGFILERYYNNISFPEIKKIGLRLKVDKWGIIFDAAIGNLATQNVLGGRFAINTGKMLLSKLPILDTLEIGFSFVSDLHPRQLLAVKMYDTVEHKIVLQKEKDDNLIYIMGADISFDFFSNDAISIGFFFDFASMDVSRHSFSLGHKGSYAIGYGVNLLGLPTRSLINISYKIQVIHSFNHFAPSYFNSLYDFTKRSKIENLLSGSKDKIGLKSELILYFFDKRVSIRLAYADYNFYDGASLPHIFFELSLINLPEKLFINLLYEDYSFSFFRVQNMANRGSQFVVEAIYGFTSISEFGFSVRKNFIIQALGTSIADDTLLTISLFGKLLF